MQDDTADGRPNESPDERRDISIEEQPERVTSEPATDYSSQPATEHRDESITDFYSQSTVERRSESNTDHYSTPTTERRSEPGTDRYSTPTAERQAPSSAMNPVQTRYPEEYVREAPSPRPTMAEPAPTPPLPPPPPARPTVPVRIALTDEELVRILQLLPAPGLAGFHPRGLSPDLRNIDPRDVDGRLEAATRSLVARGLLRPNSRNAVGEAWYMTSALIGLIGACAYATSTIRLQIQQDHTPHEVYIYKLKNVAVLRTSPMDRLQVFTYIGGELQDIDSAVRAYFHLDRQPAYIGLQNLVVSAQVIQRVRQHIAKNELEAAAAMLRTEKWDPEAAASFCEAVSRAHVSGIIAARRQDAGRPVSNTSKALMVTPDIILELKDYKGKQGGQYVREPLVVINSTSAGDVTRDLDW